MEMPTTATKIRKKTATKMRKKKKKAQTAVLRLKMRLSPIVHPDIVSRRKRTKQKTAGAEEFYYGRNGELQCAYRRPTTGHAKGLEEMAISVEKNPPPSDAEDLDMYKAKWENGDEHVVSKTNGEIKALIKTLTRSMVSSNDVFWSGTHPGTKHKLELKEKIDKKLLLGIFEQGKFLCGINVSEFSEEDMPIDSTSGAPMKVGEHHEGLKKTVLFLTPIVTAYIEGNYLAKRC